jgi:hypothetical protein
MACTPAMMIIRLTTIASTGRVMNRSVKDFIARSSGIRWVWGELEIGRQFVVHDHAHAVAQLEYARW